MKKFQFIIAILIALILFGCSNSNLENQENQTNEKRVISYEANGYLDQGIIDDIRKEQLRIKAISAYEYALPIVGVEQWHKVFKKKQNMVIGLFTKCSRIRKRDSLFI